MLSKCIKIKTSYLVEDKEYGREFFITPGLLKYPTALQKSKKTGFLTVFIAEHRSGGPR